MMDLVWKMNDLEGMNFWPNHVVWASGEVRLGDEFQTVKVTNRLWTFGNDSQPAQTALGSVT